MCGAGARSWPTLLALIVGGLACYQPNQPDCTIACGPGGLCPRAMRCSADLCTRGSAECRAADAGPRAEPPDSDWGPDRSPDIALPHDGYVDDGAGSDAPIDAAASPPDIEPDEALLIDVSAETSSAAGPDGALDPDVILAAAPAGVLRDPSDPTSIELYGVDSGGSLVRRGGLGSVGIMDVDLGAPPGVTLRGTPSAISWEPGRVDIFVRGSDGWLHQRWFKDGFWRNWVPLGPVQISPDPAAVTWGVEHLDLFVRGTVAGNLVHVYYDHGWPPESWQSRGGQIKSSPAAIALAKERIDVFARDPSDQLVHLPYDGRWLAWETLGDPLVEGPAVTSRKPGVIEVYGVRAGRRLEYFEWTTTSRGPWKALDLDVPDDFRVVRLTRTRVLVLSLSPGGKVWQRFLDFAD
jgi:hypothetical protein